MIRENFSHRNLIHSEHFGENENQKMFANLSAIPKQTENIMEILKQQMQLKFSREIDETQKG